jgi:SAM-dependent methyltransferase
MEDAVYQEFLKLEQTHWWFRGRREIFISLLDRYVGRKVDSGRRVMDLGCGVGGMIEPLAAYGSVIGTDVTLKGLEHCAARGFGRLVACTGHEAPFADESLDCITAFDALEHIEDDVGALREIYRILKPGGILVASGPAYQFLYAQQDRITHHVRRYTLGDFTSKARRAGFEVLKGSYINFILFPLILPVVLAFKLLQAVRRPDDQGAGSNVGIGIPKVANRMLAGIFGSEARLLRRFSAPAGHSLVMVVRKPFNSEPTGG